MKDDNKKPEAVKFTVEALKESKTFKNDADILDCMLDTTKTYTKSEVLNAIKTFKERRV